MLGIVGLITKLPRGRAKSELVLMAPETTKAMADSNVEVSIRGKWARFPALHVNGKTIVVKGKWLKVAFVHDEEWLESELEDPEMCLKKLRDHANRLRADIFTFSQKLSATLPKYPYPMEWESVAAIRLTSFKDWWGKLPQATRKNVRRSQKRGVAVQVTQFDDGLIRAISAINDSSPMMQGRPNAHYGKSLDQVRKDYSSFIDRSDFICARAGSEVIGFLKLVYRGEIASILNLTTNPSASDRRPANSLVARAVELCEAKGVSYITYGKFKYGNKCDSSLREFKIRNGFEEILVPRFYVPLTTKGALCMKLKLHRGLIGFLPPPVAAIAAGVRVEWHYLRLGSRRCSLTVERPNCPRQMERSTPPAGSKK